MFEPGVILNQTYQIIGKIGAGGGADVYRARHLRLKKDVAIKRIKSDIVYKVDIRAEADILKQLRHQYLPQVFDFIESGDDIYTVMDYIEGKSFSELLSYGLPLPEDQVTRWGIELCEAVKYLHGHKPSILHGDIKPSNVMLTMDEHICLIDFNISLLGAGADNAASGFSPGFSAPEISGRDWLESASSFCVTKTGSLNVKSITGEPLVLSQKSRIDRRSDVYSIGATLYCMVFGHGVRYTNEGKPDFEHNGFKVRRGLEYAIAKAMNPDHAQRFQSVQEMLHVLQNVKKFDADYRRRRALRGISIITAAAIVIGGTLLTVNTVRGIRQQKETGYQQAIQEMYASCENGDIEQAEKIFETIESAGKNRVETIAAEAVLNYFKENYDECIDKVNLAMIQAKREENEEYTGLLYFIKGESLFMEEKYSEAAGEFENAKPYITDNPEYFRDYAIALARTGESEALREANDILQEADERGIDSASEALVRAEIETSAKDYKNAKDDYEDALNLATDTAILERIYLGYAKMYENMLEDGDEESVDDIIDVLERAKVSVPLEKSSAIREQLGKAYSLKAEIADDDDAGEYALKAVDEFQSLIDGGYTRFYLYYNIAILYQQAGMYEEAANELDLMRENFPEDYRIPMQKAFLLVEVENTKDIDDRKYSEFVKAYEEAKELYEKRDKVSGESDSRMQMLEGLYHDLEDGHWLD